MKWHCPVTFLLIMAMEIILTQQTQEVDSERSKDGSGRSGIEESKDYLPDSKRLYSRWSSWSKCHAGLKTRRRHCIRVHVCGNALRIEVTRCAGSHASRQSLFGEKIHTKYLERNLRIQTVPETRQRQPEGESQRKFRGFSAWSEWSSCSRKCTTVRKRHCQRRLLCGKRVVRQSAYCYLDGSYCQQWIQTRMQPRKDPDFTPQDSSPPVYLPEYSRVPSPAVPGCGKLGRYRGTPAARLRYRMRDMVRIIGGRPSPPGKWPWQVAVLNKYKEAFCGGTLIALRWVVTAAHCVRRRLYVRLGEHDLWLRGRGEVEMRVSSVVVHPGYDPDTVVNDVALLRLPFPARPDLGHGLACLPQPSHHLPPHASCVILGWGKKRPTDVHGTRILHEAQVSTISQGVCRRSYWQYAITEDMVCAGRGRRDSCAGDSGGPLLCRATDNKYYLQGITSFGDGCGKRGKYGIYTRTAGYVSWMHSVMNKYFD